MNKAKPVLGLSFTPTKGVIWNFKETMPWKDRIFWMEKEFS